MTEDRGDLLRRIPLFAALEGEQRGAIARLFFSVERADGDVVVSEGDDSAVNFYVISAGEAVVTMGGSEINRLGPGDYFGEMALVRGRARSATVTAAGPLQMLGISGWNFSQLLARDASIGSAIKQAVADTVAADDVRNADQAPGRKL